MKPTNKVAAAATKPTPEQQALLTYLQQNRYQPKQVIALLQALPEPELRDVADSYDTLIAGYMGANHSVPAVELPGLYNLFLLTRRLHQVYSLRTR